MDEPAKRALLSLFNTPVLPEDVGEYEDDLIDILDRIPAEWGRWIDCGSGWYRLLADTHRKLKYLCPDYEIHQIKEKYGTLRYYFGTNEGFDNKIAYETMLDVVSVAERQSAHICEKCGKRASTRVKNHWFFTACEECVPKNQDEEDYDDNS
jgi:hypothetical protein